MKKIIVIIILIVISATGLIFVLNKDLDKSNIFGNNKDVIVKPEFITSMSDRDENLPTVILFKKPGCKECQEMEVVIKNLQDENKDKFNVVHYNAEEFTNNEIQDAIKMYDAVGAPTTIILKNDRSVVTKIERKTTKEKLLEYLEEAGMKK